MSRRFIVVYTVVLHVAFLAALGVIGVLAGAGATLRKPKVTHEFIAARHAGEWGQGWQDLANGRDPDIEYGRLRDATGEVVLIYITDENGVINDFEAMPVGASVIWSVVGSEDRGWKYAVWDHRSPDYDRTMGAPLFNFRRFNDDDGDGMPDRLVEKNGESEPYLKYRLVDEPWVLIEDKP